MNGYMPRYGERRCLCGYWRGEHLGNLLGPNYDLACPVEAATFVPMNEVERYHMAWEEHTRVRADD